MFVAMGLSALVPVLHGLRIYGLEQLEKQIGLSWLVLEGVLYILGAAIYAVGVSLAFSQSSLMPSRCERPSAGTPAPSTWLAARTKSFTCSCCSPRPAIWLDCSRRSTMSIVFAPVL